MSKRLLNALAWIPVKCQPTKTPLLAGDQLPPSPPDTPEPEPETKFVYQRMIGSLMAIQYFWPLPTPIGGETCQIADPDQDKYHLLSSNDQLCINIIVNS
jgi:hypothetical protein